MNGFGRGMFTGLVLGVISGIALFLAWVAINVPLCSDTKLVPNQVKLCRMVGE